MRSISFRNPTACGGWPPLFANVLPVDSEVIRLVFRAPLDIAADARLLVGAHGIPRKHRIQRSAQIRSVQCSATRTFRTAPRARTIELAAINKAPPCVEEKKIRRAGGGVGFRHRLRLVKEKWKCETRRPGHRGRGF